MAEVGILDRIASMCDELHIEIGQMPDVVELSPEAWLALHRALHPAGEDPHPISHIRYRDTVVAVRLGAQTQILLEENP